MLFNSIQTSAPSLLQHSAQQHEALLVGSLPTLLAAKKQEFKGGVTRDLHKPLPAPQLSAFPSSPLLFPGLSLQADHVPGYRRSWSSHSPRSCNLLRPAVPGGSQLPPSLPPDNSLYFAVLFFKHFPKGSRPCRFLP